MIDVLSALAIAFIVSYMAIPAIIRVAERKKLFDLPDERKIHKTLTPSLGGLGIYAGFMLACLVIVGSAYAPEFQYFYAAALVLFFLGLKDDILVISPVKKFIGQLLAAFLVINKGGLQIKSMYGFLGLTEMPEAVGIVLTYFTVLVIINSFNLIDGIDGLAGSLGTISSALFGLYFLQGGMTAYAVMAFAITASTAAFLVYNIHPAKIFMGDTGSMLIGLINAIMVVKFIETAQSPASGFPIAAAPALGFTVLLIPLMDTLRVFGIRMFYRRSPFSPDRNHIHHLMIDKGWNHSSITFTLSLFSVLFVGVAYSLSHLGCTIIIMGGIAIFFSGIAALYFTREPRMFVARAPLNTIEHGPTTVLPLTEEFILEEKQ